MVPWFAAAGQGDAYRGNGAREQAVAGGSAFALFFWCAHVRSAGARRGPMIGCCGSNLWWLEVAGWRFGRCQTVEELEQLGRHAIDLV